MALSSRPLKIATRGSPLARAQAEAVKAALLKAHGEAALGGEPELVIITTSGDAVTDRPLRDVGGKGLFTKEIQAALLAGTADVAVHSVKDMPTLGPNGLMLAGTLSRADVHDVLIARGGATLDSLPSGAVVGTTSLRRQAQILRARPDLRVRDIRGNVGTRLAKLEQGVVDALVLAQAGLDRLGIAPPGAVRLPLELMLPAVGQGAIGIEIRVDDERVAKIVNAISHEPTFTAVSAERAYLAVLDGSCHSPIAGHVIVTGETAQLRGLVLAPDGREAYGGELAGAAADAVPLARALAKQIRADAPEAFIAAFLMGV